MSKVFTNFTTDLDFRRAINEAGGNLKIDSTPEQVVNSLRAVGGDAGFNSPFETVLSIVNGDEPGPEPAGNFVIRVASGVNDINGDNWMPYIRVVNSDLVYPEEYWVTLHNDELDTDFHVLKEEAYNMLSITLNSNVHLTDIIVYDTWGDGGIENNVRFYFNEEEEAQINAMFEEYPDFIGVPMEITLAEGILQRAGKDSAEFSLNAIFGTSSAPEYVDESTDYYFTLTDITEGRIIESDVDDFQWISSAISNLNTMIVEEGIEHPTVTVADSTLRSTFKGAVTSVLDETDTRRLVIEDTNAGTRLAFGIYTKSELNIASNNQLVARIDDLYVVPQPEYDVDLVVDFHSVPNTATGYELNELYTIEIPDGESLDPIKSIYEQLFAATFDPSTGALDPTKFSTVTARFITRGLDLVAVRSKINLAESAYEATFYSDTNFPYILRISENIIPIINEDFTVTIQKSNSEPAYYSISKEYTSN